MKALLGWKTFNDRLALMLIPGLPTLWVVTAAAGIDMSGEVVGATIAGWTMVVQFYFRKRESESP